MTTDLCEHSWADTGWCPTRRCSERLHAAALEAARQAAEEDAALAAAATPEGVLLTTLRGIWERHPAQRELIAAIVEYLTRGTA